jgi:hypothetical protein
MPIRYAPIRHPLAIAVPPPTIAVIVPTPLDARCGDASGRDRRHVSRGLPRVRSRHPAAG